MEIGELEAVDNRVSRLRCLLCKQGSDLSS